MNSKLYRKNEGKLICGVCAGIAEATNIDVTIVRIITAFLCVYFQFLILVYLLLALLLPEKSRFNQAEESARKSDSYGYQTQANANQQYQSESQPQSKDRSLNTLFAVILICSGIGLLITRVIFRLEIRVSDFFMFIMMGIGIYLLVAGIMEQTDNRKTKIVLGIVLTAISLLWLLHIFGLVFFSFAHLFTSIRYLWPLLIIAIGLNILIPKRRISLIIWITFATIIILYAIYLNIDFIAMSVAMLSL